MNKDFIEEEDKKRLEKMLLRINKSKYGNKKSNKKNIKTFKLNKNNRTLIEKYYAYLINKRMSKIRMANILGVLCGMLVLLKKDYSIAKKSDIELLVSKITTNPNLKQTTQVDYLKKLKRFDKWDNGDKECSELTKDISTGLGRKYISVPKDLIQPEEVEKLLNATDNRRDRALIHFLWESGCRVGEARNLRISNIEFKDGNCRVCLDKKTGVRNVLLLECVHDLEQYMLLRQNASPDDPFFVLHGNVNRNKGMSSCAISKMLKETAIKAGFTKRMYAYLFRHSRATHLAGLGLNESQLCMIFGWQIGSKQVRTYIHLSGAQVENAYKKLYGLAEEDEKVAKFTKCPTCSTNNPVKNEVCLKCNNPLTVLGALKLVKQNEQLKVDQEISSKVFALAFKLAQEDNLDLEEAKLEATRQIALEEVEKQKESAKNNPILASSTLLV